MLPTCDTIHICSYITLFLMLIPGFAALDDETEDEVMTTKVVSRFLIFGFNASIAISSIKNK